MKRLMRAMIVSSLLLVIFLARVSSAQCVMEETKGGAVVEEKLAIPLIGDKFPTLDVKTTHGTMRLPDNYAGKWFVFFSHPADFTPVCTTEFIAFQVRYGEFKKLNAELIGLSIDQVFSHIKWVEWINNNIKVQGKPIKIEFPVIADDTGRIAKMLGLIHPGKGTNTVRAVFIVDPNGTIRAILYYPQEVGRNMDEILRMVKAFQVSDANRVSMPANWPNNELITDNVIIPPASDENTAQQRMKQFDCFDWWFCYKKVVQ